MFLTPKNEAHIKVESNVEKSFREPVKMVTDEHYCVCSNRNNKKRFMYCVVNKII